MKKIGKYDFWGRAAGLTRRLFSIKATDSRLIAWLAAYFTIALNISFWTYVAENVEISGFRVFMSVALLPVIMFLLRYIVFSLLLFPYTFKPVATLLLLVSAGSNYFMFNYKVFIDTDMVRNVIDTNVGEAGDLITPMLFLWVLAGGALPSAMLWRAKISYRPFVKLIIGRAARIACALVLLALVVFSCFKQYAFFARNNNEARKLANPENYIYAVPKYFYNRVLANMKFARIDETARHEPRDPATKNLIVFILGETARAENFSLNGYARDTNPELAKLDAVNFEDMAAAGTSTATSVPLMFSHKERGYSVDRLAHMENVLDLLKQSGYDVFWSENDGGCKKVCSRVPRAEIYPADYPNLCDGSTCYDEAMLEGFDSYLASMGDHAFYVLHTIGSHGPAYYKRYPERFEKFKPTCETSELQDCPRESIVNTYDNTILYTDYFIAKTIEAAKKFPDRAITVIYTSDHGESLGENSIYLHGMPYAIAPEQQRKVPMILWMNERAKKTVDYECIKKAAKESLSHAILFHSILGLAEIKSELYEPDKDIFGKCGVKKRP